MNTSARLAVQISCLSSTDPDLDVVQAIDRASFAASTRTDLVEELAHPYTKVWVARAQAVPVGFLVAWLVADELHVLNVAAAPAFRRMGVGMALMRYALDQAKRIKARLILLEVRRSNRPAIGLYRKLGFHVMGLRSGYYSDNGEDALEMALVLDPDSGRILPGRDEICFEEV